MTGEPSSVRIDLSDAGDQLVPDAPSDSGAPRPKWPIVALLVGAAFAVVALIVLRPDEGSTAAGTPITSSTIAPSTTQFASAEDATNEHESVIADSSTVSVGEQYEEAVQDFFPFMIVEADVGWLALGFGNASGEGTVYRSVDGLNWQPLKSDTLPSGSLIGLARVDGAFILAADELESWAGLQDPATAEHRVTFWQSPNGVDWSSAEDRQPIVGAGFPYAVSMTEWGSALPVLRSTKTGTGTEALVEYLSPGLDAEVAQRTCGATSRENDGERVVVLRDCDGESLTTISIEEVTRLWNDRFEFLYCVEALSDFVVQENVVRLAPTDGDVVTVHTGKNFAAFGHLIGDSFLAVTGDQFDPRVSRDCLPDADPVESNPSIVIWSPESGLAAAQLPERPLTGVFNVLTPLADGGVYFTGDTGLWRSTAVYRDWAEVDLGSELNNEFSTSGISVSVDGSLVLARVDGQWVLRRPGDSENLVDDLPEFGFAQLLIATDEYAIIGDQQNELTFIKVPFS